ncbi:MAG TPA: CHAT domain-containing tetratricopeptide repeat protein [Leptolyngbyaceae cyanobacterium]
MAPSLKSVVFYYRSTVVSFFLALLSSAALSSPSVAAPLSQPDLPSEVYPTQTNATQLFQDGWDAYQHEDFEQAVTLWQRALVQYRVDRNFEGERTTLEALGAVYLKLRQYDQVIASLRPLLHAPTEGANWQTQAAAWSNLALALRMTGNYVEALSVQQRVLTLRQTNQETLGEAEALINLGQIHQALGSYDTATSFYQQSLNLIRHGTSRQTEAILLASIGSVYADQGNYAEALAYYEKSQAAAVAINDLRGQAYALSNLGSIYFTYHQNYEAALDYWSQSLSLSTQVPDVWLNAKNASSLGLVYEKRQQFEEATAFHNQGWELFQKLGSKPDMAMALNNQAHTLLEWGKALQKNGRSVEAEAKFQQAATCLNRAIALLDSIRGALNTDAGRISVFDTQAMTYNLLQQVLVAENQSESALQVAEQGRSRAFTALIAEKQQLASENVSLEQIRAIARTQNATLVEYSLVPDNEFIHQGKLRGTTTELYIWVVQPNGKITFRRRPINTQQHQLEELVETSRSTVGARSRASIEVIATESSDAKQNLTTLHQILIEPIQDLLPTHPEDRVIIVPQGNLFLVPFPALITETGDYLIQHHTLLTAPSFQALALTERRSELVGSSRSRTSDNILIVGNPDMPEIWDSQLKAMRSLSPLAGAEQEAIQIADFLGTDALVKAEASEQTVKQRMGSARIIHLATHGLLEYGSPQESGVRDTPGAIALTPGTGQDGLLTSAEILEELDLTADLVVLSACDTGRGDITGDGVVGLSRSLLAAGAASVIVSLWAVPDAPTAELMTEFYRQINQGQDKAQALRQAMLVTMKQHPEPRAWAAFTLIGSAD